MDEATDRETSVPFILRLSAATGSFALSHTELGALLKTLFEVEFCSRLLVLGILSGRWRDYEAKDRNH
jgi:hypothetical protein